MDLNRPLIKQQAKELIKGQVFTLFIISFIVSICTSAVSVAYSGLTHYFNIKHGYYDYFDNDLFDHYNDNDDDADYFNDFDGNTNGWDFHNFGKNGGRMSVIPTEKEAVPAEYDFRFSIGNNYSTVPSVITAFLAPLEVALMGFYVSLIRGKRYDFNGGLKTVFKNAFKVNYLKKVGVYVIRTVLVGLLMLLFFVPGIIFSYSSYFAFQIMCDYPELSPWQAIKLSKKIVAGNRTELFVLDLSFLGWSMLCVFIIPIIYVLPYIQTTQALYYENFRLRAIQEGRVTEDDFLSDAQRFAKYSAMGNMPNMNNQYYPPYGAPQQGAYYNYNPAWQAPPQGAYYNYNPAWQAPPSGVYYNYNPAYNPVQPPTAPVPPAPTEQQTAPPEPQIVSPEPQTAPPVASEEVKENSEENKLSEADE